MRAFSLLAALVMISAVCGNSVAQVSDNPIDQMCFFGGSKPNHIPRAIDFLTTDSTARRIATACLPGATHGELESLRLDSLDQYLARLKMDSLIEVRGDKYYLTVPVFVGERRERLRQVTYEASARLVPVVDSMIPRLEKTLGDRREMLFHLLWSRVIDANWWPLYSAQFGDGGTPPSLAWVTYPAHSFFVGTNFWSMKDQDEMAITWSNPCLACPGPIQGNRLFLIGESPLSELTDSQRVSLLERDCIDSTGHPRVYAYCTDGEVDRLFDRFKEEYAKAIRGLYDYAALSKEFGVRIDDLFVILMHETAYSVFDRLDRSGRLPFPSVLRGTGSPRECARVVSIRRLDCSKSSH